MKENRNLKSKFNMYYNASQLTIDKARDLRKRMTNAEKVLWEELKMKKIDGFKFRRQHPIERFIADFYCHEAKLVIEVDGGIHQKTEQKEYDMNRSAELEKYEIKIIRFTNEEVVYDIDSVVKGIRKALYERSSGRLKTP